MKQRALPQSFWQQPNVANPQPPGIIYSTLPPLLLNGDDPADMTPVEDVIISSNNSSNLSLSNVSSNMSNNPHQTAGTTVPLAAASSNNSSNSYSSNTSSSNISRPERYVSAANTDLLFSLFNSLEEEEAQRRIHVVRRGR